MIDVQERYFKELSSFYWENGFNPDTMKIERLAYFAELLAEKNEAVNLISRKDIDSIIENHIFLSSYITNTSLKNVQTSLISVPAAASREFPWASCALK